MFKLIANAMVAYNTATGVKLWMKRYGPGTAASCPVVASSPATLRT